MARYTVHNVNVRRDPCTRGRHHVREARVAITIGAFMQAPIDRLLAMQVQDTFVTPNPDNVREDVPVAFEPCDCGGGYVVMPAELVDEYI